MTDSYVWPPKNREPTDEEWVTAISLLGSVLAREIYEESKKSETKGIYEVTAIGDRKTPSVLKKVK